MNHVNLYGAFLVGHNQSELENWAPERFIEELKRPEIECRIKLTSPTGGEYLVALVNINDGGKEINRHWMPARLFYVLNAYTAGRLKNKISRGISLRRHT